MAAFQSVPNPLQLQSERVPEASKVLPKLLEDIRQVIREELQHVVVSCKCCPQGTSPAPHDFFASSLISRHSLRKASSVGELGATGSGEAKSSTPDRKLVQVLPGEVCEVISENSAKERSSLPRSCASVRPKASPMRRLVVVESISHEGEEGSEEEVLAGHVSSIVAPKAAAKPRNAPSPGRSSSQVDRSSMTRQGRPPQAPRVNSNLSAVDIGSSQLESIEDLQQRRRRELVRVALEQTAPEPAMMTNDLKTIASAAARLVSQGFLDRTMHCAAGFLSRFGDFLVFFVPRVCGAVPWYDFKRDHSLTNPRVRANLHLVWRALLVFLCLAAAANGVYRLVAAVDVARAESLSMSAWRAMNTLDPTSLPDLAIAAGAALSLLLSGVSVASSEEEEEKVEEPCGEQNSLRSRAGSLDYVGVGAVSVHARSRYNAIPRLMSKTKTLHPVPVPPLKPSKVKVTGFARGLSLLTQYAPVLGFEASWGRMATLHAVATTAMWLVLVALRVGVFGGSGSFGVSPAVDNVCFAVVSGVLMALCFSLNMVSIGLASMVDAYCREVAAGSDDVEVMRTWAILEAVIRSVCENAQVLFLSLNGLSCVAGLCIVVSQPRAGDEVKLAADALLVAAVIGSSLWSAGSVTEKCMQVPSFVTWLIAADPDELHWDWVRVAEHITQSRAGFFVFRMRLDLASAVRLLQLFCIVALSSNVRAMGSL